MTGRDIAMLAVGADFGALVIVVFDQWMRRRPKPKPTAIEVPGGLVTFDGTLTEAEEDEFRRRWAEAHDTTGAPAV